LQKYKKAVAVAAGSGSLVSKDEHYCQ